MRLDTQCRSEIVANSLILPLTDRASVVGALG